MYFHRILLIIYFARSSGSPTDEEVARFNTEQVLHQLNVLGMDPTRPKLRDEKNTPKPSSSLETLNKDTPFIYAHPLPGAILVSPLTTIAFRPKDKVDRESIQGKISVRGNVSGDHDGETRLLSDSRTVYFTPDEAFTPGESVRVTVKKGIRTAEGLTFPAAEWSFTMSWRELGSYFVAKEKSPRDGKDPQNGPSPSDAFDCNEADDWASGATYAPNCAYRTLPRSFPRIRVTPLGNLTKLSPGYIFTASHVASGNDANFRMIITSLGDPVFYGKGFFSRFAPIHSDQLMLGTETQSQITGGSDYVERLEFDAAHGGKLSDHEFQLSRSGNGLVIVYECHPFNARSVRPDMQAPSNEQVWIAGPVVQEVLATGEVLMEWRAWDHMPRIYWDSPVGLSSARQEYWVRAAESSRRIWDLAHGNSLDETQDGAILISMSVLFVLRALCDLLPFHFSAGEI